MGGGNQPAKRHARSKVRELIKGGGRGADKFNLQGPEPAHADRPILASLLSVSGPSITRMPENVEQRQMGCTGVEKAPPETCARVPHAVRAYLIPLPPTRSFNSWPNKLEAA